MAGSDNVEDVLKFKIKIDPAIKNNNGSQITERSSESLSAPVDSESTDSGPLQPFEEPHEKTKHYKSTPGFVPDSEAGVDQSTFRPYGYGKVTNHFKGAFRPRDSEAKPWNFKENYEFMLEEKTLPPPTSKSSDKCKAPEITRNKMIEAYLYADQKGFQSRKTVSGPMNIIHEEPKIINKDNSKFNVTRDTLITIQDKSRYGHQKTINYSIPAFHVGQISAPQDILLLKMGQPDMENIIVGPRLGRKGYNRISYGRYAGKNGHNFNPAGVLQG